MMVIQIMGNLGADPETRFTTGGQKVTSLRVACNSRKGGKDETVWWRVSVWGDRFDKMMAYLKKGSSVIVVGAMSKPEIYMKDNQPQISLNLTAEMLMFPPLPKQQSGESKQAESGEEMSYAGESKRSSKQYDLEEEHESLPF